MTMQSILTENSSHIFQHRESQLSVLLSPLRERFPSQITRQLPAVNVNPKLVNLQKEVLKSKRDQLLKQLGAIDGNVARYELALCTYRNRLSEYADYLRRERENLTAILESWVKIDDCAIHLYEKIISSSHLRFQESVCEIMNSLSNRYPSYQIKKSNNMGLAIDNALCAVEVSFEDVEMLQGALQNTQEQILEETRLEAELQSRIAKLKNAFDDLRGSKTSAEDLSSSSSS